MCVYVFGIHVLKIAVERWFWEVYMVFGSLVELHVGLYSCLCFSLLEKLLLKASLTPPRHLFNTSLSVKILKFVSYHNLNSFSTPGGSIEKVPTSSMAFWLIKLLFLYLMVCSSTPPRYLYLSKTNFSTPSLIDVLTPLDISSIEIYLGSIYTSSCNLILIPFNLSLNSSLFSLQNNLISLQSWSSRFLQAFLRFSSLGKLFISHSSCISCFET